MCAEYLFKFVWSSIEVKDWFANPATWSTELQPSLHLQDRALQFFPQPGLETRAELVRGCLIPVSAQGNQSPKSQQGLQLGWQKCEMLNKAWLECRDVNKRVNRSGRGILWQKQWIEVLTKDIFTCSGYSRFISQGILLGTKPQGLSTFNFLLQMGQMVV